MDKVRVRVDRWEELEVGMDVVLTECRTCGDEHELRLTELGSTRTSPSFVVTPHPHGVGFAVLVLERVAEGRVFRLVDREDVPDSEMSVMLTGASDGT